MKRLLLLFTLGLTLSGLSFQAQAQGYFNQAQEGEVKFGIRGGANYFNLGSLSLEDSEFSESVSKTNYKTNYKLGFQIGGYADIWIAPGFSFMPEINFIVKGAQLKETLDIDLGFFGVQSLNTELKSSFYYVEAPILLGFKPIPSLRLFAGPQGSYLVHHSLKISIEGEPTDEILGTEGLRKFIIGGAAGAQFDITKNININARYMMDFNSAFNDDQNQSKMRNSGVALSIGYSF